MKRINRILALAAMAGAAFVSCNKAEINTDNNENGVYTYRFTLSDDATRSTIGLEDGKKVINWESGDQLGVYAVSTDNVSYNRYANIDLDKQPNEFAISSYMALEEGDMVYAYAPYVKFSSAGLDNEDWKSPTTVPLSIPAAQTQKASTFDADAMPKVSIPYPMPADLAAQTDKPVGDIKMLNLGAIIDFKVYSTNSTYATEKVLSITFEADKALAGSFVFDLTAVDYDTPSTLAISGYEATSVTTTVTNPGTLGATKDAAYEVYMVVAPGTYTGNVIVVTNEATYTYPVTAKEFKRNVILNLGVNLRENVRKQEVNYVTLDWTFPEEGESATIEALGQVVGVKMNSIGSYAAANAPYQLQFNADNDYIQVKTDAAIGAVSLDYKMIGGGTTSYFDIYESTNGFDWGEAVERLTAAGSQNSTSTLTTSNSFNSASRYVKINFVKGSNVGVGRISITKPNTDPAIIANDINNVPAVGVSNQSAAFEVRNFTNDVKVASFTGCVSSATISNGAVLYSIGPNYEVSAKTGTIVLQSESNSAITKTINVHQLKSSLTSSTEELIIPANADEGSFTVTSPEFGWTVSADDDSHIVYNESGNASETPVTVTVVVDVDATEAVQTIATLTVSRCENDPQAKTILVKKAAAGGDETLYSATFEESDAHRTSGNNSYSSTPNTYTVSGVEWSLTFADSVTSGSPLDGSANVMARIAKNTTNIPIAETANLISGNKTITKVTFLSKLASTAVTLTVEYSTDGTTWTTVSASKDTDVHASYGYSATIPNVVTSDFRLRFSWSVASSTGSHRDSQLDDVIVYGR